MNMDELIEDTPKENKPKKTFWAAFSSGAKAAYDSTRKGLLTVKSNQINKKKDTIKSLKMQVQEAKLRQQLAKYSSPSPLSKSPFDEVNNRMNEFNKNFRL